MDIELLKFEESGIGWEIEFEVKLNDEESSKCNLDQIKYVGDYEIKKESNKILFTCDFDAGELRENETIDERLKLIEKDIISLTDSCLL